jgi:hypothetical protein
MSGRTHAEVPPLAPAVERRDPDALAIYLVLAVLGALRLSVALALAEPLGSEATVALAMLIAGAAGLVSRR